MLRMSSSSACVAGIQSASGLQVPVEPLLFVDDNYGGGQLHGDTAGDAIRDELSAVPGTKGGPLTQISPSVDQNNEQSTILSEAVKPFYRPWGTKGSLLMKVVAAQCQNDEKAAEMARLGLKPAGIGGKGVNSKEEKRRASPPPSLLSSQTSSLSSSVCLPASPSSPVSCLEHESPGGVASPFAVPVVAEKPAAYRLPLGDFCLVRTVPSPLPVLAVSLQKDAKRKESAESDGGSAGLPNDHHTVVVAADQTVRNLRGEGADGDGDDMGANSGQCQTFMTSTSHTEDRVTQDTSTTAAAAAASPSSFVPLVPSKPLPDFETATTQSRIRQWHHETQQHKQARAQKAYAVTQARAEDVHHVRWLRSQMEPNGRLPAHVRDDVALPLFISRVYEWGSEMKAFRQQQWANAFRERSVMAAAEGLPGGHLPFDENGGGAGEEGEEEKRVSRQRGSGGTARPLLRWNELHDAQNEANIRAMQAFVMSDAWRQQKQAPSSLDGDEILNRRDDQLAAGLDSSPTTVAGRSGGFSKAVNCCEIDDDTATGSGARPPPALPSQLRGSHDTGGNAALASWAHISKQVKGASVGADAREHKQQQQGGEAPVERRSQRSTTVVQRGAGLGFGGIGVPAIPIPIPPMPQSVLPPSGGDAVVTAHYGLYERPRNRYSRAAATAENTHRGLATGAATRPTSAGGTQRNEFKAYASAGLPQPPSPRPPSPSSCQRARAYFKTSSSILASLPTHQRPHTAGGLALLGIQPNTTEATARNDAASTASRQSRGQGDGFHSPRGRNSDNGGHCAAMPFSALHRRQGKKLFHFDFASEQLSKLAETTDSSPDAKDSGVGSGISGSQSRGEAFSNNANPARPRNPNQPRNGVVAMTFPFPLF